MIATGGPWGAVRRASAPGDAACSRRGGSAACRTSRRAGRASTPWTVWGLISRPYVHGVEARQLPDQHRGHRVGVRRPPPAQPDVVRRRPCREESAPDRGASEPPARGAPSGRTCVRPVESFEGGDDVRRAEPHDGLCGPRPPVSVPRGARRHEEERCDDRRDYQQTGYTTAGTYETEQSGWTGWIVFAGVMMIISGSLNALYGLIAVVNDEWVVWTNSASLYLDLSQWGGPPHPRTGRCCFPASGCSAATSWPAPSG